MKAKYIRTKSDQIIIFSLAMNHSDFRSFEPVSAGFITIGKDQKGELRIDCYGKSVTLKLESDVIDSKLALNQYKQY